MIRIFFPSEQSQSQQKNYLSLLSTKICIQCPLSLPLSSENGLSYFRVYLDEKIADEIQISYIDEAGFAFIGYLQHEIKIWMLFWCFLSNDNIREENFNILYTQQSAYCNFYQYIDSSTGLKYYRKKDYDYYYLTQIIYANQCSINLSIYENKRSYKKNDLNIINNKIMVLQNELIINQMFKLLMYSLSQKYLELQKQKLNSFYLIKHHRPPSLHYQYT